MDGAGCPEGLQADTLNSHTRMISIVDTYYVITTDRCYDSS